jgi:trans-aconitate 2-methyltransferase
MSLAPAASHWNAQVYTRIARPQLDWGRKVLDRLALVGDEVLIDAGCGSGGVTELLCERLPHGHVIALDASPDMLREARARLAPRFGDRVSFVQADLHDLQLDGVADVIFSTATFHWVLDHDRLFAGLFRALRPGGRLHAQCGGGPILHRLRQELERLRREPPFAAHLADLQESWYFADDVSTARRLDAAGFVTVDTWHEPAPAHFDGARAMKEFLRNVTLRAYVASLPGEELRERFLNELLAASADPENPLVLDFWRLNIEAWRP